MSLTAAQKKKIYTNLAAGYGMPGIVVDGQDVFAVAEAAKVAIARDLMISSCLSMAVRMPI